MNKQFDFDQLLDSWLADGPSELPEQAVSRIVQSIDDNERRLSWLPRRETMNRLVVAAGSVAAIVLVAVIGFGIVSGGGTSGPGAAPSPSPSPSQLTEGDVEPGRYFHEIDGYRYTFTVPESGWSFSVDAGGLIQGDDDTEIAIFWPGGDMPELFRRACDSSGTEFDTGPSVDDLANALASLEDFEATAPADVTVSGYEGKRVALTVPADADVDPATEPHSPSCDGGAYSLSSARWYQTTGQTDDMWILDIDGVRQLIVASDAPGTPADVTAQLEAMVASMEIESR